MNSLNSVLGDVDFDETLFIVDMQDGFIDTFLSSGVSSEAKEHCVMLRKNIVTEVENSLNSDSLIVVIEFNGKGKTVKPIEDLVKQESNRVITLLKKSDGVTAGFNGEDDLLKTTMVLNGIKERGSSATVRGINTGFCVLESAIGIRDEGITLKIPLGTTLNLNAHAYNERNSIAWNLEKYGNDSDLLDFGDKPNNLQLMSDYL